MSVSLTPLRLDTTSCDRCGRCASCCRNGALRIGPGYIYVDWERCDGCGSCAEACDRGAITLRGAASASTSATAEMNATEHGGWSGHSIWSRGGGRHSLGSGRSPKADLRAGSGRAGDAARGRASAPASGGAWSLAEAALTLAVAFSLLVGAQALFGGLLAGSRAWAGTAPLLYDAVFVALAVYLARRRGSTVAAAFRLDVAPEARSVPLSVAVGLGCWLFSVTYRAIVLAAGLHPGASESGGFTGLYGTGAFAIVMTVGVLAVLGPALEELLLRGVVLPAVSARFGVWSAILFSALAFALLHGSLWSLLPLTVLGVGVGWLAVRSRSLWPAILAHVLYNAVLIGSALYSVSVR